MKFVFPLIACAVVCSSTLPTASAKYLGAETVLARAAALAKAKPSKPKGESVPQLRKDIAAFAAKAASLPPADAASGWLALADRAGRISRDQGSYESAPLSFPDLVKALPSPSAWRDIRSQSPPPADATPRLRLERLWLTWYADRLLGDATALKTDYDALVTALTSLPNVPSEWLQTVINELARQTLSITTDIAVRREILQNRCDAMIAPAPKNRQGGLPSRQTTEVPDLVLLVGEDTARELLTKLLTHNVGALNFRSGGATEKLAAKIALAEADKLSAPQWYLTCTTEGGDLYRKMLARFKPDAEAPDFSRARTYAFYRAVLAGDVEGAIAIATQAGRNLNLDSDVLEQLAGGGRKKEIAEILRRLLEKNPRLNLWSEYIGVSVSAGLSTEMLAFVQSVLQKAKLDSQVRQSLQSAQLSALLAANRVDDAVSLIRIKIATPAKSSSDETSNSSPESAITLASLGAVLDHKDWLEEGLTAARNVLKHDLEDTRNLSSAASTAGNISRLLLDQNRGDEAEAIWIDVLGAFAATETSPDRSRYDDRTGQEALIGLTGVYTAANRSADVLVLAEQGKYWGAADLSALFQRDCYVGNRKNVPLGICIARALAATGRSDEATKLVQTLLPRLSGDDAAYATLVDLLGQKAIPVLDQLFALNAFEERPLIWKAKLLLDAKKLDDADRVIRQAIQIDPSDGEQGPDDRMRAYSVLADVLAAKGGAADAKQAEVFRGAVKSIRLAEHADVFYQLGLLQRAIELYEKSLDYFADAYCVQSRLALRLSETGDWKAAEEHYRRAYELMPESFGRVESHCFGCERAFAGERQQSIAERVFTGLAAKQPDNPRVHYLLGYLLSEKERPLEAIPEFQKAVELDPDYLNAWIRLSAAPAAALSPAEHNRIASNLIRLDPSGRHRSLRLSGVTDLPRIWDQLAAAEKMAPKFPTAIFPFPASARRISEMTATESPAYSYSSERLSQEDLSPGAIFSEEEFSSAGGLWMAIVSSGTVD